MSVLFSCIALAKIQPSRLKKGTIVGVGFKKSNKSLCSNIWKSIISSTGTWDPHFHCFGDHVAQVNFQEVRFLECYIIIRQYSFHRDYSITSSTVVLLVLLVF